MSQPPNPAQRPPTSVAGSTFLAAVPPTGHAGTCVRQSERLGHRL